MDSNAISPIFTKRISDTLKNSNSVFLVAGEGFEPSQAITVSRL